MKNYENRVLERYRVLMLIPSLGYGGAENSFIRLSNYLAKYHDVTIVVFKRSYGLESGYTDAGLKASVQLIELDEVSNKSFFSRWFIRWKILKRLKHQTNVAISFLSGANLLNCLAFSNALTIISERASKRHFVDGSFFSRVIWPRFIDPIVYRLADKIVSVSYGLSDEILHVVGKRNHDKVVTIEGYVDVKKLITDSELSIEPEIRSLADIVPLVTVCGRLHKQHKQKGFQYLLPIFAEVTKQIKDTKLLIIGDGSGILDLLGLCGSLGLKATTKLEDAKSADVIFLGYRNNPNRYLKVSRLFVLSSLYEGLPNILIEALSVGVPSMAADCPWGPRSILARNPTEIANIINSKNLPLKLEYGILMPRIEQQKNFNIWVTEIVSSLNGPLTSWPKLSQREEAVKRFDIESTGGKWLQLIDGLYKESI